MLSVLDFVVEFMLVIAILDNSVPGPERQSFTISSMPMKDRLWTYLMPE